MNKIRKLIKEEIKKALLREDAGEQERLSAPNVNYMGPDKGPFKCGHCKFFNEAKGFCQHPEVRAHVEAEGCCNEYQSLEGNT